MTAPAGDTFSLSSPQPGGSDKAELRRRLRRLRSALSPAQRRRAARLAAQRLLGARRLREARHIAVYLPVGAELATAPLAAALRRRAGCTLWVPRVGRDGRMHFVRWARGARLRRDCCGMPVPAGARERRSGRRLALIVLPLVGFDHLGHRLGTGGGYYDRALAGCRLRRPWLVGYAYAVQEAPAIPPEPWDIALHAIATERGWRRLPGARSGKPPFVSAASPSIDHQPWLEAVRHN